MHEKLRTINTVDEIKDYTNQNTIEIRDMKTNEKLKKFVREKKLQGPRRNLSLTPY